MWPILTILIGFSACVVTDDGPPRSMTTEGVPKVPAAIRRAIRPYRQVPGYALGGWLGGRRELLLLAGGDPAGQVDCVAAPGLFPHRLTDLRGRLLGIAPRPGRNQFALATDADGDELVQLALFDTPSARLTRLTRDGARHFAPVWSPDGRRLAFVSDRRNGRDLDLWALRLEPRPEAPELLAELPGLASVEDWSPDGRQIAVVASDPATGTRLLLVDAETGATRVLVPNEPPHVLFGPATPRFEPDGRSLLLTAFFDQDSRGLARIDLESGRVEPIPYPRDREVDAFALADDGRTLAVQWNERGNGRLDRFDLDTGRLTPIERGDHRQFSDLTFRPGSLELAFNVESTAAPRHVASVLLDRGTPVAWMHDEALPALGFDPPAEPTLIHYPSFDGRQIPAFVYRPDPDRRGFRGPRPVLIDLHGGPQAQFRPGFLGEDAFWLNQLAIALVYPNVRGSSGYGRAYMALDDGPLREDAVKDVGALLDWIATQPDLDPARVIVRGGSYGGYLTLAALAAFPERIRAGIDIAGISNFATFMADQPPLRLDLLRLEFGDESDPATRDFLASISPLARAASIRSPLLVVQGQRDPRVPVGEARQIVDAVRANGVEVWYLLAEDEGHGYSRRVNLDYLFEVQVQFVLEHVRASPRP